MTAQYPPLCRTARNRAGRRMAAAAALILSQTAYSQTTGGAGALPLVAAEPQALQTVLPEPPDIGGAVTEQRQAAFESALDSVFPMTPDMVRRYRGAVRENEEAIHAAPYPVPVNDAALVTLEPGEPPVDISVAPGIASVVGFHDAAGKPWPIRQYILGDGKAFQIAQLGEMSSAIAVSPLARIGWTNLVIALAGEESPVVLKIVINPGRAHFRRSIQVMKLGPASQDAEAAVLDSLPAAGDRAMIAALTGAGIGDGSVQIPVSGVDALVWRYQGQLYVRSRHPLLSPPWSASLAGPGGLRAYQLGIGSALLFSVGGRITRATLDLP